MERPVDLEEKKARSNELARMRMKRYRERMKHKKVQAPPATRQTKNKEEERRKQWRESKAEERARWSAQKRRRVNEKRRQRYRQQKEAHCKKVAQFVRG